MDGKAEWLTRCAVEEIIAWGAWRLPRGPGGGMDAVVMARGIEQVTAELATSLDAIADELADVRTVYPASVAEVEEVARLVNMAARLAEGFEQRFAERHWYFLPPGERS